ncbi:hypothetical protein AKUA1404_00410 [Apilactobacillus kunkeei]|uniref:CPBP family intramembrane metalloprotease n=1 Tax=Apilactobacillus nanyangensis TaxID=2799579 RepID=A0ABT0HVW1_9LACO|nr:CPBP family intramembrane glutamic endopeptidase [Apilactobacillus nanyangensis]MCK8611078.1 CPBP family intramembrane metalloprotease [Apilactobacillus nanyangensis]CAI2605773.1 hypothetical protein AKUA1404_00410 [Apilactobacillus kunkeei]
MTILKRILILIGLLILSPFVGLISYPLNSFSGGDFWVLIFQVIFAIIVVIGVMIVLYRLIIRDKFTSLFKDNYFSKKIIVYTIEMILVVTLLMLMSGTPNGTIYQKLVHMTSFTDVRLQYFFIIISVILAPIVEELYFRGLIFTYVNKTTNLTTALIISSLFFGLAHSLFNPFIFITHAIVAIFIGLARNKSNGIIAPIIMHMIWNLLIFLMVL